MDYFLISLKSLLFTGHKLCMNNASSGMFLTVPSSRLSGFRKGLSSSERHPAISLKQGKALQPALGDVSNFLRGGLSWACRSQGFRAQGTQVCLPVPLLSVSYRAQLSSLKLSFFVHLRKDAILKYFRNHS